MADYYELLGVDRQATAEEIKRAYRRRARELHPDTNPDHPEAEEQFKQIARAYEVLSDPEQRARYDRFGESGVGGPGPADDPFFGAGGLADIFSTFFGGSGTPFGGRGPAGPPRGQDQEVVADLTFEQAVFGATVPVDVRTAIACGECGGSGAGSGTKPVTCADCNGTGQVRRVRQSLLGQMVTAGPCTRCGGLGQVVVTPCGACGGEGRTITDKTYQVDVPAGVDHGTTLRLAGRGAAGPRGGAAGDLYVHLRVQPHPTFHRDGYDLVAELHLGLAQVALGTHFDVTTLDGDETLVVPPGTQPGREFRLRGRGVPHVEGRGRGDLRLLVVVDVPTKLSDAEEDLLRRYAAERAEDVSPPEKGLFKRLKTAFK
ncbi:MAG TPA: molecular chaperone DnaJ [Acidimicrobiales bacterium]